MPAPPCPPPAPAAAPILPRILSSVAPVALAAALVCGVGPGPAAAVVAQAVPFVRPPPQQRNPLASSTPYAQSQKLQFGLDKLGFVSCPACTGDAYFIYHCNRTCSVPQPDRS